MQLLKSMERRLLYGKVKNVWLGDGAGCERRKYVKGNAWKRGKKIKDRARSGFVILSFDGLEGLGKHRNTLKGGERKMAP